MDRAFAKKKEGIKPSVSRKIKLHNRTLKVGYRDIAIQVIKPDFLKENISSSDARRSLEEQFNPDDDGEGGPGWAIEAEFNNNLKHNRGTLSMIRGKDPNSAGSQFFISLTQSNNLDGKYTIFAHMISGDITLSRIANITLENQQGKMLCEIKIPDNANIENWVTVKDPISDKDLFSKVPISENKNSYKIALQKKLNNIIQFFIFQT